MSAALTAAMIIKTHLIRPGMTAIAAVIALSSTPLLAQEVTPQTQTATPAAPAQVTPPPVVRTAPASTAPTTVTPVTPQPAAPVIQAVPASATPTITPAAPAPAEPAPVARATEPDPASPARSERTAPSRAAAAERRAAPAETAPAPEAQPIAPPMAVEAAPFPAPLDAQAAPVPIDEPTVAPVATTGNDMLPLIGAGVLAALALGAAGFALSRRRRRSDADESWARTEFEPAAAPAEAIAEEPVAEAPQPVAEAPAPRPAFARDVETDPAPIAAGPAKLANGFDLSRYGRHVQAAYRGPTPDNPFVSLKKRLTRAHFYDMQEARAAEAANAPAAAPQPAATRPAEPARDRFEVRRPGMAPTRTGGLRPAFQR